MKAIITNESKDNNPSPLEALEILIDKIDNPEREIVWNKTFNAYTILQTALTNYANMVESLEGLRDGYDADFHFSLDGERIIEVSQVIADITKVLEGK
jgi:tRNA uridine 5-carbamoylmethylation protein Kti12